MEMENERLTDVGKTIKTLSDISTLEVWDVIIDNHLFEFTIIKINDKSIVFNDCLEDIVFKQIKVDELIKNNWWKLKEENHIAQPSEKVKPKMAIFFNEDWSEVKVSEDKVEQFEKVRKQNKEERYFLELFKEIVWREQMTPFSGRERYAKDCFEWAEACIKKLKEKGKL